MSLVPTYVLMGDGKYHVNPILSSAKTWFICFDDEDPPELVIFDDELWSVDDANSLLKAVGIKGAVIREGTKSHRILPSSKLGFASACSYWIEIQAPPPASLIVEDEGACEVGEVRQGVIYDWRVYE